MLGLNPLIYRTDIYALVHIINIKSTKGVHKRTLLAIRKIKVRFFEQAESKEVLTFIEIKNKK